MKIIGKIAILIVILATETTTACRNAQLMKTGVTEQEKYDILETHNRLRQSVAMGQVRGQPGAENMMEMKWDSELAAKAQQWASECTFEHDPSRYLNRFTMGQNLAIMWSTEPLGEHEGDFPSRIQNWFNEVNAYNWGASWSPKTGHYSQLVWGETNLVGCGFSSYYDGYKYNKLWVCNYGPGGNVVGVDPYSTGSPACQNFGLSTSSRYPGLCTDAPTIQTFTYNPPQQNYITDYNTGKYTAPHKAEYTRVTFNKPQKSVSFSNQLADYSWNQPQTQQYYQEPKTQQYFQEPKVQTQYYQEPQTQQQYYQEPKAQQQYYQEPETHIYIQQEQPVQNAFASFKPVRQSTKSDRSSALLSYNWDAFFN
ncbi:scoloptoxin SSD976-like [Lutzomyia longipalpis]|uniref:scoloptoxin SSD976-like n=1 Tax=Lutzomyia longipalpis TaxID=7200 RepID=UPI002483E1DA|nr:scoloptoxin SSD976-like [Lutzomyia longipalpis]